MNNKTTVTTDKLSHREWHGLNMSALATSLASHAWINLYTLPTECDLFVGQHIDKSIPRSVSYMFCQSMGLKHIYDIQILDSNQRICFNKLKAEFVQKVSPLVSNLNMLDSQSKSGFPFVIRSFHFPTKSSIQEFQSFFSSDQVSRISYTFAIAQSSKVLQANINTNLSFRWMDDFGSINLATENSKPLTSMINFDGESFNLAFWNTVQDNRNITHLGSKKSFVGEKFISIMIQFISNFNFRLWKSDAIYSALKSWKTFLFIRLIFNTPKKVLKCFMNPIRYILDNLAINIRRISFSNRTIIKFIKRNLSIFPRIYAQSKKFIIDSFTRLERINQSYLLLSRRIYPIPIHSLNDHTPNKTELIYKTII